MLNKLSAFIRSQGLIKPADHVVCAVSGGADSVALLLGLYLLRDKLGITLSVAHFNHGLRGAESDRDQAFVRQLCSHYDLALHLGSGQVVAGDKGLEAAARKARYGFFDTLSGKIATAHTADDNAETVLMHMIRGTGLKGLGGIAPSRGKIIRPMLSVTRQEVLRFLQEYHQDFVEDSTNQTDAFLRNRLRHHVMPLLQAENPSFSENMSEMALRLRQDEQLLSSLTEGPLPDVPALRKMEPGLRSRYLSGFLEQCGVKEPGTAHIRQAEQLVFSQRPSARAGFPNNVTICRNYDRLEKLMPAAALTPQVLQCPGVVTVPEANVRIICTVSSECVLQWDRFTVCASGPVVVRGRMPQDTIRLQGGNKSLKELFIDKKIPAAKRVQIPVIADDHGVLAVYGIGANLDRISGPGVPVEIRFEKL